MMFRTQVYIQLALAGKHGNELVVCSSKTELLLTSSRHGIDYGTDRVDEVHRGL
jgi:hypothetical protein